MNFRLAPVCSLRLLVILGLCLGQATVLGSTAQAQEPSAESHLDEEARAIFQAGRIAYDQGRFQAALEHFERAYELSGRPELLYNIGTSADRLRMDERALEVFVAYLAALPNAPNAAVVRARIEVLQAEVDRDRVAAAAEAEAESQSVEDAEVEATAPIETTTTEAPPPADGPRTLATSFIIAGSILAAGGIGSGIWWLDRQNALDQCGGDRCTNADSIEGERDWAARLTLGLAAFGVGGIITGLLLLPSDDGDNATEATLRCLPTGPGVSCVGRF